MLSPQVSIFFITCLDSVCCDGVIIVENPLAEASPDLISHMNLVKGSKGAVGGECQKEEEAGLPLCNFPVPCSCACLRGPHTLIVAGASSGTPMSEGHEQAD